MIPLKFEKNNQKKIRFELIKVLVREKTLAEEEFFFTIGKV